MSTQHPLLIGFVATPAGREHLQQIAQQLHYRLEIVAQANQIAPPDAAEIQHRPGEPLHGRQGSLLQWIVERQPALLIFDLDNEAIPWSKWIATLKSSPASRRLPILAYTSAADEEVSARAQGYGADAVVSYQHWHSAWPELIQTWVHLTDYAALDRACADPLPAIAIRGLELFNAGEYYECHHALEEAWNQDQGVARNLYKGILQVAVAYFQLERGNYNGGHKLLLRMRQWLEPLPAVCRGVEVRQLLDDALQVQAELQRLGPERLAELDKTLFKPVKYSTISATF